MNVDAPAGFTLVGEDDKNAKVQSGDLLWDEGAFQWLHAVSDDIGHEVYGFNAVARADHPQS
ncbi:hypothetical protein BLL42_27600 (plasmid) [Pseudomonas frederiksbergensis]|uniref:Uncharacterized protein n=1 Tax=Pseudomonas frederiksbergensis TaxID=104087 RepID=A0A1J0ETL6_9PSED|nr:hypothetical protein [Pseudomonas frederiksbergensis]APC19501.1 hypothetical protein BLL42_27600 [Pseudomonas frederiksbergensis]